jgi:hypothetical protein
MQLLNTDLFEFLIESEYVYSDGEKLVAFPDAPEDIVQKVIQFNKQYNDAIYPEKSE